ncbi:hypothetical protein ACFV7Q_09825 [Streptomyces sp. NPDC059851]|uniref:hypothetical protein n=1 Tax=Streptomyces sp. NPDC059851 TaxID=3346971 RepID=UPI00364F0D40
MRRSSAAGSPSDRTDKGETTTWTCYARSTAPSTGTCRNDHHWGPCDRAGRHLRPAPPQQNLDGGAAAAAQGDPGRTPHRTLAAEGFTHVLAKTEDLAPADTLPEIRLAVITDPDRRHASYWATPAESFDHLLAIWNRDEDMTAEPVEFTDPLLIAETRARIADTQRNNERPSTVMVGSAENGQWVNWNLPAVPRPPVPQHPRF